MKYCLMFIISLWSFASHSALEQPINPEGLYMNNFSGGVAGLELIVIRSLQTGGNQYIVSNVSGRGVIATILPDGQIEVTPQGVVGNFDSEDTAQFSITGSQPNQYDLTRIALTEPSFLNYNGEAFPVNPLYAGSWSGVENGFDLITGDLDQTFSTFIFNSTLTTEVENDGTPALRSTEFIGPTLNGFFQGVMDSQRSWIIQIGDSPFTQVDPELALPTLPGTRASFDIRFFGRGRFNDINTFTNTILVESRDDVPAPPQPKLFLFQQTLVRQQPLVPGDFDNDGSISNSDRDQIMALYGLDDFTLGYNLLADIDNNGIVDLRDSTALDNVDTPLMTIDAGFSGSWFNTSRNGEGWNLAILPGNRAIIAFFTYAPDGSTQSWIVGVGNVVDNEIIFSNLNITGGALFGDLFNPDDVERTTWGDIRIYFTDCNNGAISYGADQPFDNNARPISRLTTLAGISCGQTPAVNADSQAITGSWFSPIRDGEGIIFEALPDGRIVMYWYTYDTEGGEQYWLGGVGSFDATTNTAQFDALRSTTGTAFGDAFTAGDVAQVPWGSASFQQLGCDNGVLNFSSTLPEFGDSSYPLIRLTGIDTLVCDPAQFSQ